MDNYIHLRGVRENNLKNINLDIPRDKLVVLTGLSGCGKSSLAFDTIFAEEDMLSHYHHTQECFLDKWRSLI